MTVLNDPWTKMPPSQKAKFVKAKMHFYFQEEGGWMIHHPHSMGRRPSRGHVVDDAQTRGHSAISALLADHYIDHVMASRGRQLIEVLFKTSTVDASIAPEDGGLIFYWAALEMAITIQVFPSSGYWWSVRNIAGTSYSGAGSDLPLHDLRYSLNQFSKEVELQNPNWRSIVR
ncbi:hypothetical protein [Mycobacterium sp. E1747]|uniref:hypothetical protein n=1 Tax=Mycobacterium sp. E1747 TaxID=1834128 RepID=UPI000831E6E1|nr:hypothetical protein [Mycobacterium sp. E1747]